MGAYINVGVDQGLSFIFHLSKNKEIRIFKKIIIMKILVIYQSLIVFRETKIQNVYSNKDLEIAVINTEFDMGDKIVKILTVSPTF